MPSPPVNSSLNYPLELSPALVPVGGGAGQVLAKSSGNPWDLVWIAVAVPSDITNLQNQITALNTQISTINTTLTDLQDSIDNNTADIDGLLARMQTAESSINNLNAQVSALSAQISAQGQDIITLKNQMSSVDTTLADHEQRIDNLEGGSVAAADPYIGAVVHVRDSGGHCQPAVVYEDWQAQNAKDIVSVVVVAPYRLQTSNWNSKIEVQKENGSVGEAFSFWHWPERYYAGTEIKRR